VLLDREVDEALVHVMHAGEPWVCVIVPYVECVAPHVDSVHADELPRRLLDDRDPLVPLDLEVPLELELLLQVLLRDAQDQESRVVTVLLSEELLLDLDLLLRLRILRHVNVVLVQDVLLTHLDTGVGLEFGGGLASLLLSVHWSILK
jgi:hypothetical protein